MQVIMWNILNNNIVNLNTGPRISMWVKWNDGIATSRIIISIFKLNFQKKPCELKGSTTMLDGSDVETSQPQEHEHQPFALLELN